jgi:hypothetical protein
LVLSVTAVDGVVEITGEDFLGINPTGPDEGDGEWSDVQSVTMPEMKIRDAVHYDHFIKIELYWENKTSGEWTYWALDVSGQELIKIPRTASMVDGYGENHNTLLLRRELSAQFTVFLDDSDGESVSSDGEYDIQRDEYKDLLEEKMVRIDTNANLSVEELPSVSIPLAFSGFMRSYFDPHLPLVETLEDGIYGEGQTISVGDTGDWVDETSWTDVTYDWEAEKSKKIAGYDVILINVSTDFGDEDFSLPFKEMIWIANEVSAPVKQFIRTNTSWDGEEEAGYILLENTFELRDGGFTPGTSDIPWGECTGYHWLDEHPNAETESWSGNFMPKSGDNFEESSFYWKPEEVIDWLKTKNPSEELDVFLSQNPDAIVTSAEYNASVQDNDPFGQGCESWWNLTFGIEREQGQPWGVENRYRILVYNNTEYLYTDPLTRKPVYETEIRIDADFGKVGGSAPLNPDDLQSQTVTMASSEQIFKTDSIVARNFYTNALGGEQDLQWGDGDGVEYSLSTSSGEQGGGMDLIATLTGIQTQTWSKYAWNVVQDELFSGGTLTSASLDAETGRLISILEIEGTALENAVIGRE